MKVAVLASILMLVALLGLSGGPLPVLAANPPLVPPPKDTASRHPKLDATLNRLVETHATRGLAAAQAVAAEAKLAPRNGLVSVIVESQGTSQQALPAARSVGGTVLRSYQGLHRIEMPVSVIRKLADSKAVRRIRAPLAHMVVETTSEGVALTGANTWQTGGYTGAGVKVAIVDLGFQGYTGKLGSELPATVNTVCSQTALENGEAHGTAVAEIIHDMAPDANLYLVNINDDIDLGNAVACLIGEGVQVANHSVAWAYEAPGDGTGVVNGIVNTAVAGGIFWANAAGNYQQRHWSGSWSDPESNGWLNFSGSDEGNTIYANGSTCVFLRWNDTWGGSANDYDLYLYPAGGADPVVSSQNWQNGAQDPVESFCYAATAGNYDIRIYRYDANGTARFDLLTFRNNLQYPVAANSLPHPADNASTGMVSVGAVPWSNPTILESYSSQGPTTDGRIKPDISAPDCTNGTVYGSSGFCGTSASSPHTAGAAALVKQVYPFHTPAQIKAWLELRAVDLGAAGKDNQFGAGRLSLGGLPVTSCPAGQYLTQYYNNRTLGGSPDLVRCETAPLNYAWGTGGPGSGVSTDSFSGRWTGSFSFISGTYNFTATTNDGMKVWVDDTILIDQWSDRTTATTVTAQRLLSTGYHTVKVEYYEASGTATAQLAWDRETIPTSCPAGEYLAQYYNNRTLSGSPSLVRCETAPLYNEWGAGGPGSGINPNGFSARWTGNFTFEAGTFDFIATVNDGMRIWVDNVALLDQWYDRAASESYTVERSLTAGAHVVKIEYYENDGNATTQVRWERYTGPPRSCPSGQYLAKYFNNRTLSGSPTTTVCESAPLYYDWGIASPLSGIAADDFSGRWTGSFPFEAGIFNFTATADDGVRVWLDNVLIIDRWIDQPATSVTARRAVTAGSHTIKLEYYENRGGATVRLGWERLVAPAGCATGQYTAQYYNNTNLAGPPALTRCETTPISYDWGTGGPGSGISGGSFSGRWTGSFLFSSGVYDFTAIASDGARLWIDDSLLIDQWDGPSPINQTVGRLVAAGRHTIKVEYYNSAGTAQLQARWVQQSVGSTPCSSGQYLAQYFNSRTLSGAPAISRCEGAPVAYDWGVSGPGVPGSGISNDSFSARWSGSFYFAAGVYAFTATADDGVRVWLDDVLIVDRWIDQPPTAVTARRSVSSGTHTVRIEYYEAGGGAVARVGWRSL